MALQTIVGWAAMTALLASSSVAKAQHFTHWQTEAFETRRADAYAGVYLQIDLGGVDQPSRPALSYGLRAGITPAFALRQPGYIASINAPTLAPHRMLAMHNPSVPAIDLLNVRFSARGFEQSALIGLPLVAGNGNQAVWVMGADEGTGGDDKDGGVPTWVWVSGGLNAPSCRRHDRRETNSAERGMFHWCALTRRIRGVRRLNERAGLADKSIRAITAQLLEPL